ncbi:MAG TPA: hypothetical protein VGP92_00725 [Acidimicrobiia bacterium]|nr:hypothetical protein [Acidimicrobiia bacterium]
MKISRKASVAATAGAMLAAGTVGYLVFAPVISGAQTTTNPGSGVTTTTAAGTFKGNEDPTHEKAESAQREADEQAGRAHFGGHDGGGNFTPNTDPAHEKTESAARQAEEKARQGSTSSTTP